MVGGCGGRSFSSSSPSAIFAIGSCRGVKERLAGVQQRAEHVVFRPGRGGRRPGRGRCVCGEIRRLGSVLWRFTGRDGLGSVL